MEGLWRECGSLEAGAEVLRAPGNGGVRSHQRAGTVLVPAGCAQLEEDGKTQALGCCRAPLALPHFQLRKLCLPSIQLRCAIPSRSLATPQCLLVLGLLTFVLGSQGDSLEHVECVRGRTEWGSQEVLWTWQLTPFSQRTHIAVFHVDIRATSAPGKCSKTQLESENFALV